MRALKLTITPEQHLALLAGRRSADRDFAERCLYVLLNAKGLSTYQIAELLIRDVRVVRHWLKAYDQQGLEALHSIKGAGGRPRTLRDQVQEQLEPLLAGAPKDFGLHASHWTRTLLAKACENRLGRPVSVDTVHRVLRATGWRYIRSRKVVPEHAPDAAEKKATDRRVARNT